MQALTAVSPEAFAGQFWKHPGHYQYAVTTSFVPLSAAELRKAAAHLPLAFVKLAGEWQLVAILSLLENTNLLVGPQGQWLGAYVPAALRAHPFRLVRDAQQKGLVLATLDTGEHLVPASEGQPFFEQNGLPSAELQRVMNFLIELENGRVQITRAATALFAAGVLSPWELVASHNGQDQKVAGLFHINEAALAALSPEKLLRLRNEGGLPVAYAQIFSEEQLLRLQQAIQTQEALRAESN
ncbi:SapC family protein [Curvibacter sp. RS43]|uniref:SapC family protein n=1 Tax=Curvibacter microcysteis TaxID=3026419 RepID=A0ABT5MC03_9BURK|nr:MULTISPECIES: SapC family protein [unclassified Curvibacter]MDD0811447.1 SapC family protein [Curvibacter sp. RS43]MDD0813452.1 SapC family protein [Curvibacter sp. HBC28]